MIGGAIRAPASISRTLTATPLVTNIASGRFNSEGYLENGGRRQAIARNARHLPLATSAEAGDYRHVAIISEVR